MSESAIVAATVEAPAPKPRKEPINYRKAMAGVYFLRGDGSLYRCLRKAGFAHSTSRVSLRAGLSAEICIAEANKLNKGASPAKLLQAARERAYQTILAFDPSTGSVGDIGRVLDIAEKHFGSRELPPSQVETTLVDRLTQIVAYLVVAQQRGLPVPRLDALNVTPLPVAVSQVAVADNQAAPAKSVEDPPK